MDFSYEHQLIQMVIMIAAGLISVATIMGLVSMILIRRQVEVVENEKPSLANTVLPKIQESPMALAVFWGLVFHGACSFGTAVVSRLI